MDLLSAPIKLATNTDQQTQFTDNIRLVVIDDDPVPTATVNITTTPQKRQHAPSSHVIRSPLRLRTINMLNRRLLSKQQHQPVISSTESNISPSIEIISQPTSIDDVAARERKWRKRSRKQRESEGIWAMFSNEHLIDETNALSCAFVDDLLHRLFMHEQQLRNFWQTAMQCEQNDAIQV
jgi:hypothetical protein